MISSKFTFKKGFTVVELLVYIVSMTIVLGVIVYFTMQVYGLYRSVTMDSRVSQSASTVMQVLATQMRSGNAIDQSESTFGTPLGTLNIDAGSADTPIEKQFDVVDGRVQYTEDGQEVFLTPSDMTVSKFLFTQVVTPVSYAVRYEIDLTYMRDGEAVTNTYPGLVILRRSYD